MSAVMTYREALYRSMRDALAERPEVIIFGQGADDHRGTFGTTLGLAEEFGPERVCDTPLAEEGMTGIAITLATREDSEAVAGIEKLLGHKIARAGSADNEAEAATATDSSKRKPAEKTAQWAALVALEKDLA